MKEEKKMQVHKIEILILDFDEIGADECKNLLENNKYFNRCIFPEVKSIQTQEIGEWSDNHPLNNSDTSDAEYRRLFGIV